MNREPAVLLPARRPRPLPTPAPSREMASTYLLQGRNEVFIVHGGERYRLRRTRNDKLILTK